ncbi:hypothetical protein [Micromonospora gifhornensis]|uniref:hypothetical protein n=1 Tax=Micromonospora gifhornensis TaxID=84594 RepID=UPI003D742644
MMLWLAWSGYLWLGNQTRVDLPPVRRAVLTAMAPDVLLLGEWTGAAGGHLTRRAQAEVPG